MMRVTCYERLESGGYAFTDASDLEEETARAVLPDLRVPVWQVACAQLLARAYETEQRNARLIVTIAAGPYDDVELVVVNGAPALLDLRLRLSALPPTP